MQFDFWQFVAALGIPSAFMGLCVWLLKKHLDKKDEDHERKEEARKELDIMLLRGVGAAISLGEATARAVQRIPDAHCNGDMHAALDYATKVKHEQKDFMTEQGVEHLHYD